MSHRCVYAEPDDTATDDHRFIPAAAANDNGIITASASASASASATIEYEHW